MAFEGREDPDAPTGLPEHPLPREDLAWRDIDGRVVVVDPVDSQLHDLSETATFYWLLMDGTRSLADLSAAAALEFDVDDATALADLEEFVAELVTKGLLVEPGESR